MSPKAIEHGDHMQVYQMKRSRTKKLSRDDELKRKHQQKGQGRFRKLKKTKENLKTMEFDSTFWWKERDFDNHN